jgi:protein SCO1
MKSVAFIAAFIAALVLVAFLSAACTKPKIDLPEYGDIPQFTLTAQTGQPFDSGSELKGHIWVADFVYTTCVGPCPRMTSQMRQLQQTLERTASPVKLVSFTVDPARDTPEALAAYAKLHHASPGWYFLTGPVATLQLLDKNAFKLGDIDGTLEHSTRFVLVDQRMRIRGYYDTSDADSIAHLLADIQGLS